MGRFLISTLATYAVLVLQTVLAPVMSIDGSTPNLVLVALSLALPALGWRGVVRAAFCGLMIDALGTGTVGANVVCYSLFAALLPTLTGPDVTWRFLPRYAIATGVCLFAADIGGASLATLRAETVPVWTTWLAPAASRAVYGAGLVLLGLGLANLLRRHDGHSIADVSNRWMMLTG